MLFYTNLFTATKHLRSEFRGLAPVQNTALVKKHTHILVLYPVKADELAGSPSLQSGGGEIRNTATVLTIH